MKAKKKFNLFPERLGYLPYLWPIYLGFPLHFLVRETIIKMIVGYILLAIFVVAYRQAYVAKKTFELWVIIEISIIFIYSGFYNISYLYMNFFPAAAIGGARSRKRFFQLYTMFIGALIIPFLFQKGTWGINDIGNMLPFFILMLLFPFGMRTSIKRRELQGELNKANQQIKELVKQEERQRIARDLHDTLGHTLSLITLKSQLVEKFVTKDLERAKAEARDIEQTSRNALKQVRELVANMKNITIHEEILQVKGILQAADIEFRYEESADIDKIPSFVQNMIAMCMREAITNVVKHSAASRCCIKLEDKVGAVILNVSDNGKGIQSDNNAGNGLTGIRERLDLLDGTMNLSSGKHGTTISITVPIIVKGRRSVTS